MHAVPSATDATANPLLLGLPGVPSAPDSGTLFRHELDSAAERAGGTRAIEHVQDIADARRGARQADFRRYREHVSDERDRAQPRHDPRHDPHTDRAPTDRPPPAAEASDPAADPHASHGDPGTARAPAEPAASIETREPLAAPVCPGPDVGPQPSGPAAGAAAAEVHGEAPTAPVAPVKGASEGAPAGGSPATKTGKWVEVLASARAERPDAGLLERAEEILRQIRLALQPSARRLTLELAPSDLGRLAIRMSVHRGELSTVVRAESPHTLELLEQRLPQLRALLAERGFDAPRLQLELGFGAERRAPRDGSGRPSEGTLRAPADRPRATVPEETIRTSRDRVDGSIDTYA